MTRRRVFLALAGLGVIATLLVVQWQWDLPTLAPEVVAERVRAAGPLGPLALLAWFVLQCVVVPLPSEPAMMAAGFVYGFGVAFGITWLGVVLGAAACFGLARRLGGAPSSSASSAPSGSRRSTPGSRARGSPPPSPSCWRSGCSPSRRSTC
jgi:uncharacterized membrane protein YdjX (TVP38/TMEM64 family)